MYHLKRAYSISPHIGLVLVPQNLLKIDDPPMRWYILHEEVLRVHLRFPISQAIARFLSSYDLNLSHINPSG